MSPQVSQGDCGEFFHGLTHGNITTQGPWIGLLAAEILRRL